MSPAPASAVVWAIRVLALAAGGTAAYLWYVTAVAKSLPIGCGADSGCGAVLTSQWSSVAGFSVAALALALHTAIFFTSFGLTSSSEAARKTATGLLTVGAWLLLGAAIWFIGLQWMVLHAICPWCLADHSLGALLALTILIGVAPSGATAFGVWPPAIGAMALLGVLMGLQVYLPPLRNELHRLEGTAVAEADQVKLFDGAMIVNRLDVPQLGAADAPKTLALMFDYCCPHCRATHGFLAAAQKRYPGQILVLTLPTPMNTECNPHWEHTEPRFKNACELARFALAVWRADPTQFPAYDAWLFEPEAPREVAEAQTKAESLVGQDAFADALADKWVDDQIKRNVDGYAASKAERVPVLAGPGLTAIVGRPDDEQALYEVFEREWKLTPASPSPTATSDQ